MIVSAVPQDFPEDAGPKQTAVEGWRSLLKPFDTLRQRLPLRLLLLLAAAATVAAAVAAAAEQCG
jgi:hypothetical protein